MMVLVFLLAWKVASPRIAIVSVIGLLILAAVNLWDPTMVTVAIMIVSVFISIAVGIPMGVLAARNDMVDKVIHPILDTMQTMPSFVYLIPVLMLFGLGKVPAVLATLVYAVPPFCVSRFSWPATFSVVSAIYFFSSK